MTAHRLPYDTVTERDWQNQVIEILQYHGYRVAHFRAAQVGDGRWVTPVQADGAGFPDLLAVHPKTGDFLVAELKTEKAKVPPHQLQWLSWFEAAGWDAYVFRPSQVDDVIARAKEGSDAVRRSQAQEGARTHLPGAPPRGTGGEAT